MNAPLKAVLTDVDAEIANAATPKRKLFDPERSKAGPIRKKAPQEFPFLVDRLFPIEVGVFVATGGVGKTTLLIWLITRIALELPIFDHEVKVNRPKILVISNEDGEDRWGYRFRDICKAMNLTDEQQEIVDNHIFFEDQSGIDVRMVVPAQDGDLALSSVADELIEKYKDVGLSMVILDPLVGFSPGERFVNDGSQMLVTACRRICKALGTFTLLVHHVNKDQAQKGDPQQHAGRGGTALGDGCRFEAQVVAHTCRPKKGNGKPVLMPLAIGEEMLGDHGTAYALYIHKLTDAKLFTKPFWIYRQGYNFTYYPNDTIEVAAASHLEKDLERRNKVKSAVVAFIAKSPTLCLSESKLRDGHAPDISAIAQFKVTNTEVKEATAAAISEGLIWTEDVPQELKRKGVSTRLVANKAKY
jgi:hypothetical protein